MLVELNCNMVRCWGGNVYESDRFFDLCDQAGILVWQDFAMACAVYPQDEDFLKTIAVEAESVVKRLRNHPSLALWSGNNEGDDAWVSRSYAGATPVNPDRDRITVRPSCGAGTAGPSSTLFAEFALSQPRSLCGGQ